MKKPAIPQASTPFEKPVKERLEIICGDRGQKIKRLDPATATTAEIAAKINEILSLLQ